LGYDELSFHQREYERLRDTLIEASDYSALPDVPSTRPSLDDLLIRVRLNQIGISLRHDH
jgi:uncharacterized protein